MAYDGPNAKYNVVISRWGGFITRSSAVPYPIVYGRIGAALVRAMLEFATSGLSINQLATGLPNVGLSARAPGQRLDFNPAHTAHRLLKRPSGVYTLGKATQDDFVYRHVPLSDVTFDAVADETLALPEYKTWCEAFGGTYTDNSG